LVTSIKETVDSHSLIVHLPGSALRVSRLVGLALHDVPLTRDEYRAMADGLADTDGPTTGLVALSQWLADHRATLGARYANELKRHFDTTTAYINLPPRRFQLRAFVRFSIYCAMLLRCQPRVAISLPARVGHPAKGEI
jgi:hypothetical protein